MKFTQVTLAMAIAVSAASAASAETDVTAADPQTVVDALTALDHSATLTPLKSGRPSVKASAEGRTFYIDFNGCKEDMTGCRSLLFTAWARPNEALDLAVVNEWNNEKLYTKAFIDPKSSPRLEMPVVAALTLDGAEFRRIVQLWLIELGDFSARVRPG